MNTHIIPIACAKGGVTKTTTAMLLAASLHKRGLNVVVLDTDNTGGATKWEEAIYEQNETSRRQAQTTGQTPHLISLGFDVIPANQATMNRHRLQEKYPDTWIIIDTPPSDTGTIQKAIDVGDVTIIPTQTSAADLRLAGETYAATRRGIILLTRVKAHTRLAKQAIKELDDAHITRFETLIPERESIRAAYGTTSTDPQYAAVVQELIDYINQLEQAQEA